MSSHGTRTNRPQYGCSHVLRYLLSFPETGEPTPRQVCPGPTWDLSVLDPSTHDGVTTLRRLPNSQLAKEVNNIFGDISLSAVITEKQAMSFARGILQEYTRNLASSRSRVIVDGTGKPYKLQITPEKLAPNLTSITGTNVMPVEATIYEEDPVVWVKSRQSTGATVPTIIPFTALKSELQAWGALRPHDNKTYLTAPFTAGDFVSRARTWADDSRRTQKLVVDYFKDDGTQVQVTLAMSQSDEQSGEHLQERDPQTLEPDAATNRHPMKISSTLHD